MSAKENEFPPRILSDEEIEMYLKNDSIEVNRLILYNLNRLAAVLVPHAEMEEEMKKELESIGGFKGIKTRADYVDSLIKKNNRMSEMMEKVAQSGLTWALIAFFGFLAHAVWGDIVRAARTMIHVLDKAP